MATLAVLAVMSGLILVYLSIAVDSAEWTHHDADERRVKLAAQSTAALAVDSLWGRFERVNAEQRTTPWSFRKFLDDAGILNQGAAAPVRTDLLATIGLPDDLAGTEALAGVKIERMDVWRRDIQLQTQLTFEVTASSRGDNPAGTLRKTVRETYLIERGQWEGLDYALLANNINCIMCHTEVDNVERVFNSDPARYGTFQRAKIGSLENFQLRADPQSWVAGTLYLAGVGLERNGDPITDWGSLSFKSRAFDDAGYLAQDGFGSMLPTHFQPADADAPVAAENLYLSYADDVDGYLPTEFPSPFPDDGGIDPATGLPAPSEVGNREVDATEFDTASAYAHGSVRGGSIAVLDPTERLSSSGALEGWLAESRAASLDSKTHANVYLRGTADDPIVLNGEVAIAGDLIIEGYVKGTGSLRVAGNVYVPSDLEYADTLARDGQRLFGVGADGTANAVAIAAGKNIMVGDIFTSSFGSGDPVTGDTDGNFNFILDELAIFNRMEWIKTQEKLPGKTERVKVGEETVEVEKWKWQDVEYEAQEPIYERREYQKEVPVFEKTTYEEKVPIYDKEYGTIVGYKKVTKTRKKKVGTKMQTRTKKVVVGHKTVTRTRKERTGKPWIELETRNVFDWVTPQLDNPHYRGPEYTARYYAFTDGSTIPIHNKDGGYFDPASGQWLTKERPKKWSTERMDYARVGDPNDPFLYDADGSPKAAVSTLTASSGWLTNEVLEWLMKDRIDAREGDAFEIDATLYSNNSIFGILPERTDGLNGELVVNGSIVAADVGLLAPRRLRLNYDARGKSLLNISNENRIRIRRQLAIPVAAHE